MRAINIAKYGDPIVVKQIAKPKLVGPKDVLIKMHFAPINPSDIFYLKGVYGIKKPLPTTGGFEGCGIIEDAANKSLIGKKVSCWAGEDNYNYGTWADYFLTVEKDCIVYNQNEQVHEQDWHKYSSPFINPFTACSFLDLAKAKKAECVVFQAASSAVARMAIKLFHQEGIKSIAIVHEKNYLDEIKEIGATHVFHDQDEHLVEHLQEIIAKEKAKMLFDPITGPLSGAIFNALKADGQLVTYGKIHRNMLCDIDPPGLFFKRKSIRGFWLPDYLKEKTPQDVERFKQLVHDNIHTIFQTRVNKVFPLEQIEEAYRESAKHGELGKNILKF
ncbi:hypothetical protein ABPG74_022002 [Tetrahymena malaccensis]